MRKLSLISFAILMATLGPSARLSGAQAKNRSLFLFSDKRDITNTWGKIHFGATSLQRIGSCVNPGFELSYCAPREDAGWDVYGQVIKTGPPTKDHVKAVNSWQLIHATTYDGTRFQNVETVLESEAGAWVPNHAMAYNPEAKEFMLLKLKMDNSGFRYTAYFSPDGRNWKEYSKNPLFYDGDAISLFWSPKLHRLICVSKTLQPVIKHFRDHGGPTSSLHDDNFRDRRVLSIRSSPDGRQWEPSDSMDDVWDRGRRKKSLPVELMTMPDENDPPDLEFYSGNGFWYHDRSYMMVLNYAASPLLARKHGPHLDTEWWVGRDGLHWERPYRDVNATGPEITRITHNPMIIDGMILFHYGDHLLGMKQDRISYVGARANAEFSTASFQMPRGDLLLNAAIPAPDRTFAAQQAYIMAGVLDEKGIVVPGFEADKCLFKSGDQIDFPLLWNGRSARELVGQRISLRLSFRSANIYAISFKPE